MGLHAWVCAVHGSGSGSNTVVSYFWVHTLQKSMHSSESCWMPHPLPLPFLTKGSPLLVWLQSSHTLFSILSLQTEAHSPWVDSALTVWAREKGPRLTQGICTCTHAHNAGPASWCKGNSRGNLPDGAASVNLCPSCNQSLGRMLIKVGFLTGELTCLSGISLWINAHMHTCTHCSEISLLILWPERV